MIHKTIKTMEQELFVIQNGTTTAAAVAPRTVYRNPASYPKCRQAFGQAFIDLITVAPTAVTPAVTPAVFPSFTPAFSPAFTPAVFPSFTPAVSPTDDVVVGCNSKKRRRSNENMHDHKITAYYP